MLENTFKTGLVKELKSRFPGCIVLHADPNEIQGIPDLVVLYEDTFMQHGLFGKGSARKNHKYYQRVEVGTDRNGNTEYYYFYSKEAYDNYRRSRAISRGEDPDRKPTRAQQKKRAEAETDKEKKARMKAAKKRYNKKMSAARRKRAVQKGAQRVARLLGK